MSLKRTALAVLCLPCLASAQPAIQWQKLIGGSASDQGYALTQTPDGGFLVTGFGASNNGDFADHHGSTSTRDCIVIRVDSSGNIVWKRSLGGSGSDGCPCMALAPGGGYVVAGGAASADGDVTDHHGSASKSDGWIVKLDPNGNTLWTKSYGGTADDDILRIVSTNDGGYLFVARSLSNDLDVSNHHGSTANSDFWVVKIDSVGKILWQKSLGGTGYDAPFGLARTNDSAFVICGYSSSNDGDVSGNHGGYDTWVVKINDTGKIIWQNSFGSTGHEDNNTVTVTTDGGYIVGGSAYTKGGDVPEHYGHTDEYDMWVFKLSPAGTLVWSRTYGGNGRDYEQDVHATPDGGCQLSGYSTSNDIDVSGHHADTTNYDAWIVKLDSIGSIQWQQSLGGSAMEGASGITPTRDGGCAFAANTVSTDGDLTGMTNHGNADCWIVKLARFEPMAPILTVFPQPIQVGNRPVGTADTFRCRIMNAPNATAPLVISQMRITGDADVHLLDAPSMPDTVSIGDSLSVQIEFMPTKAGDVNAALVISSNASSSDMSIPIVGGGFLLGEVEHDLTHLPGSPTLRRNYPNPFAGTTRIEYTLPARSDVTLSVFDCLGREVAQLVSDAQDRGPHTASLDAIALPAGVYSCRLRACGVVTARTMYVVK